MGGSAGCLSCAAFFISSKETSTSSLRNHRHFISSSYIHRNINLDRTNGGKNVNFIKRALLSVKERKAKSFLQLIVFTVICVLIIAGLSIQSAADKSAQLARESLGGTVTLQYNSEKMMKEIRDQMGERPERGSVQQGPGQGFSPFSISNEPVKLSDAEQLIKSSYVKAYNFVTSTTGYTDSVEPVEIESNSSSFGGFGPEGMELSMGDITVSGQLNSDLATAFMDNTATLVEGRHITEEDKGKAVVLIEQTLADQNELAIGDSIEFGAEDNVNVKNYEIVGIYQSEVSTNDLNIPISAMLPYNTVYVPFDQVNPIKGDDAADTLDSAIFYMKDATNIDAFIEEANSTSIDFETYMLDANNQLYEQMVGPIENVSSFSKNIVYLVTIAGALILGLLIMLSIRERKYEMGVLIAIGERKWKLIGQFLVEVLVIAVLALGISYATGGVIADQLGNKLLENQLTSSQEPQPESFGRFGGNIDPFSNSATSQVDVIDEIKVEITPKDFGLLALIGFLIAIIATVLPSLTVLRLKPKAILSKQD